MSGVPIGPDRTKCCRDGGTMTRFFGEPWDAPMVDDGHQVPTPVGEPCLHCGQAIVDGDQGFIMSVQSADGMAVVSQPAHWHCWLILARRSTRGESTVSVDRAATLNPFTGVLCVRCGVAALTLVWKLEARPLGTFSLAGVQLKVSAREWPYCVCDPTLGGCGAECRGKQEMTS